MRKTILLIISIFCIQLLFSQELIKENDNSVNSKEKNIQKKELTSKEKYAIKMLKSGYRTKSIMIKTFLTRKRLRELKKEYL